MPNPENELPHAQFVQVIFNGIADWVGKYRHNFGLDSQFGLCTGRSYAYCERPQTHPG
jgi:hypothetical protein